MKIKKIVGNIADHGPLSADTIYLARVGQGFEMAVTDATGAIAHKSNPDVSLISAIAAGSTLGLQQQLLADAGQPGRTVLAVGNTTSGKVQGISLATGNVIETYANGADFNAGIVRNREFMALGEPICFTGLQNGAIITSSGGFYGFSEQIAGPQESPMPLLSFGLSFKSTFLYAFRNSETHPSVAGIHSNQGWIPVVNGPITNVIKLTDGDGVTIRGQEDIQLGPWQYRVLYTSGNKEYILSGTQKMMACITTGMKNSGAHAFLDSRLIMPLTNDGITWARSGYCSAPFDDTAIKYYVRDGVKGNFTASPGTPANVHLTTGATEYDYEPNGAVRLQGPALSAYSGADSAGGEATPMMPLSGMSQVVAQPLFIKDSGDGGNSGIAIATTYTGTAKIYEWDDTTKTLVLKYNVSLTRTNVTVTTAEDQQHPCAGGVANEASMVTLVGDLKPGVIVADVPIMAVVQNGASGHMPTLRSQNGTTTTAIMSEGDETLTLGWTPAHVKAEIKTAADGLLYRRVIGVGGADSWVLC